MKILVTGACGFVGSTLIQARLENGMHELVGFDNLIRPGSELNRLALKRAGVKLYHGDVRCPADLKVLPALDVVVEAAALSLAKLPTRVRNDAFEPDPDRPVPAGLSIDGVREDFSTAAPISLYGATKLASEQLALEYGMAFGFLVWINRCRVLAGTGQFGRPDQGIFAYWMNSRLRRRSLGYIGFDCHGYQVRDCLHPGDLVPLLDRQFASTTDLRTPRVVNVSGGRASALSLCQLSNWCRDRLGDHVVTPRQESRQYDIPRMVLDATLAAETWDWQPSRTNIAIFEEILKHAEQHPEWLELSESA